MDASLREIVAVELGATHRKGGKGLSLVFLPFISKICARTLNKGMSHPSSGQPDCTSCQVVVVDLRADLTYAGSFHGLLGLTGPSSILFFAFQRVICSMQELVGPENV